jgi:hypothetical protein
VLSPKKRLEIYLLIIILGGVMTCPFDNNGGSGGRDLNMAYHVSLFVTGPPMPA